MTTRRRAARRRSVWLDTLVDTNVADSGADIVDLMGSWDRDDARGLTLARTILELSLIASTAGAADGKQVVDLAIGVVSREAFAAGVVPDPNVPLSP